jgi:beta-lactamase class A
MSRINLTAIGEYIRSSWRRLAIYGFGSAVIMLIIVQLALPWNNLPLYMTIDGRDVSGQDIGTVTKNLDTAYAKLPVNLYFGNSPKSYRQPTTGDIGVTVSTAQQVQAANYPLWLRLVPTSLWWAHRYVGSQAPTYKHDTTKAKAYVQKELGQSCDVKAVNASVQYKDKKLKVVPAIDGGTCKIDDVEKLLIAVSPRLNSNTVRIPVVQRPAKIQDGNASDYIDQLTKQTQPGVAIQAGGQNVTVSQSDLLLWLDFAAPDSGIIATVNTARASDFFTKQLLPKVTAAAGTSHVTTLDFTEVSRDDGPSGRTLDTEATVQSLNDWLSDPTNQVTAATKPVAPNVVYTRTYTPTDAGMTALITQFAQAHPGTFGVSFAELDGQHRHAGFQDTKVFQTASTYKLFVAYSTLKRIENGTFHWSDQVQGGRDMTKCFDDMIVRSDNNCAEALLSRIGFSAITKEIHAIGLNNSSFLGDYIQTTAADLTTFVGTLQSGQLLSPSSTNTLISAMKRNIYRQGIPAGANGTVADKVGFLNALLHDASIVYSPSGTYALTIMTDGSSWGTIAELTRQIEKLRTQ